MNYIELKYNDRCIKFEVNRDDFIEYLWEQKTNKKFRPNAFMLDDPGLSIYKTIEKDWLNNNIDEYVILRDSKFGDFLIKKYDDELYALINEDCDDFIEDKNINYLNDLIEDE